MTYDVRKSADVREGREHDGAVLPDAAAADEDVADDEQHAGRGVQRGVEGGRSARVTESS